MGRFTVNPKTKKKEKASRQPTLPDDGPSANQLPDTMAMKLSEHEVLSLFEKMLVNFKIFHHKNLLQF